jgi:hypothetical protein
VPSLQFFKLTTNAEIVHIEVVEVFIEHSMIILKIFGLLRKIGELRTSLA